MLIPAANNSVEKTLWAWWFACRIRGDGRRSGVNAIQFALCVEQILSLDFSCCSLRSVRMLGKMCFWKSMRSVWNCSYMEYLRTCVPETICVKETKLPSKSGVMCESCVPAQNPLSYLVLLKTDKFSLSNRSFLPTTKVSGDMLLILVLQESQLSTWLHVSSDLRLTMFGTSFVVYECFNIFFLSYQITRDEQGSCYILLHHSVSQSPLPSPNFEISRNFRIFTTILQELNFCATIVVNFFQIVSSCAWWFC